MAYLKLFVFISALVVVQICDAQNNTQPITDDDDNTVIEETALERGMAPIFKLYHTFLDTVMPDNFYDSDSAFNVQKLTEIIKNEDFGKLQNDWQDLSKTFGGYAACIIMGLLFVAFMPLVGIIYCCCHCCCHKCGGTRETVDPKLASCKRMTFAGLLLVFTTLMLAGGIILFLGSEMLYKSLKNEDNKGLLGKMDTSLGRLQTFTDDTIKEVKTEATALVITNGLNQILPRIEAAADSTVENVKATINITQLLQDADNLGTEAKTALDDLKVVQLSLTTLRDLQTNVTTTLNIINTSISNDCASAVPACSIDTSSLNFNPDFSGLDELTAQADKVSDAQNISKFVENARKEFVKTEADVKNEISGYISDSKTQISDMNKTITDSLNKLDDTAKPFTDAIQEGRNFTKNSNKDIQNVGKYIWYVCIGMGCAVMLVVLFYYLGVLFGLCGERPGYNANCCNRGTGSNLLCTGVLCSFLFGWLLMFVVILLFSTGGLSYTMACRYIGDGIENVDTFEQVLNDGFKWNVSKSLNVTNLTISSMFTNCKNNEAIYTALRLDSIFNIDTQFNVTDVKAEVNKIKDTRNFNIDNVTLLTQDLKDELKAFADAGIANVNFTEYQEQLAKPVIGTASGNELDTLIDQLVAVSKVVAGSDPTKAESLNASADGLSNLKTNQLLDIEAEKIKLGNAITDLQRDADLTVQVNALTASIQASQNKFNSEKDTIVQEQLGTAADEIITLIDDTVSSTKTQIKTEIGKCRPLYDAVQDVVDAVCTGTFDPLNAIWFGLGWSLFFYIPTFIFAVLLASLYKRTERYRKKERGFDDVNHDEYQGYQGGRDDNIPLTSRANQNGGRPKGSAATNQGYDEGRDYQHEPRYHRDDNYRGDQGRGPTYAQPYAGHNDRYGNERPPQYDEVTSGYPQNHGGYPKSRHY